ncbi:uncharacterized protein LOC119073657 isoform X2 [Bradysia coprophila]|uniref:uncharacterized protein LOC119073657 isoform X2 n=1 Tax=Bradysia coprophila TaxID=38358 RepID=UPI00187DC8DF|nr:uncharacterized protein LOC119073657 isoform X2 [Bradysia coprophila]
MHSRSTLEEADCNSASSAYQQRRRENIDLTCVDNRLFESPRGRGRNNPGWGRTNGLPFVSPRGRGRRIPLQTRSQHPDTTGDSSFVHASSDLFDPEDGHRVEHRYDLGQVQQAADGTLYYSGLVRIDNRPFESPRGRGRNNPGWGRSDGRPFLSQRGHRRRSTHTYAPSAPTYEDILDVDN